MNNHLNKIALSSITAAVYVAACLILSPISFGPVQFRFAEMLCLLSIDYMWAYVGVIIGCFISNTFFGGLGILDMVFGTLATVIGCGLAHVFRKKLTRGYPLISALMIVVANGVIVGIELGIILETPDLIPLYILEVAFGELVVMLVGLPVYKRLKADIDNRLS